MIRLEGIWWTQTNIRMVELEIISVTVEGLVQPVLILDISLPHDWKSS